MAGRWSRQSLPTLAAAGLLLPAIIVLAVWTNGLFDERRAEVERSSLEAARQMTTRADAEADANSRVLQLMASSQAALDPDMVRLSRFVTLALEGNAAWTALVLRDRANGDRVMLEMGQGSNGGALRPLPSRLPGGPGIEGVFAEGRYCPCVVFHKAVVGRPERVLTLFLAPDVFQRIMQRELDPAAVGAIVDRDGRFLARSVDYQNRVGTPATVYVRRASAAGGEGLYRGRTYEGLANVTAYVTSPATRWSGHVAIDSAKFDNPRTVANIAVAIALLAALVLATGLLFYAAHEGRRRRDEEARLVAMQKAEAISHFTGTAVHDFRNILAVIEACARLIVRRGGDPELLERTAAISDAVARGNRLSNQLLSFARGDGAEVTRVDLRKLLNGCDELLRRSLGDAIAFSTEVAEDARFAMANADQLELALLNLAVNARDAMEAKGVFSIGVTRAGETVEIAACDDGPGVPRALRERIFEAFYSTKGDGKGTGLGLAQVAGAARQAGGGVELRDREGGGACFVIVLPGG